jgi:hypothetical protein
MLVMSIASTALMELGLVPDENSQTKTPNKEIAKFNIDLLSMLKTKTKGHLTPEEAQFLDHLINDLQLKFVQQSK